MKKLATLCLFIISLIALNARASQVIEKVPFSLCTERSYTDTIPPIPGAGDAAPVLPGGEGAGNAASVPNAPSTMTASDSLKMAFTNLKSAFSDVSKLFARKSDTMSIVIPQVEYDNSSLAQLKENLKKVKGVRSVTMRYTTTTATLQIAYKGKPTDVWDTLPADVKAAFKVMELGDTGITLQCKQKTF